MLAVVIIVDKLFHWTKQLVTQMTAIYEQIDNMHEVDVSLTYGWVLKNSTHFILFLYIILDLLRTKMLLPALNLFNEPKKWGEDKIVVAT